MPAFTFILACFFLLSIPQAHAQLALPRSGDFKKADSVAALYPRHSLTDLRDLTDKLTGSLPTSEEKFRAIYRWVCNNIEYDYSLFQKNKRKREELTGNEERAAWNKEFSVRVFKTLVGKQRTVCTGYAYLIREMAMLAGLPCMIIDGYGRTIGANVGGLGIPNHSWNAVQLYGKWYLCDPTWSSGAYDPQTRGYVKRFDPAYFLADPAAFIRNHYPTESSWMLLDAKPSLDEFLNGPLIYTGAFAHDITPLLPATFEVTVEKGRAVAFQFSGNTHKRVKKAELLIVHSSGSRSISKPVHEDEAGRYTIVQPFTSKGIYIVHLVLNDDFIFTYRVKVK